MMTPSARKVVNTYLRRTAAGIVSATILRQMGGSRRLNAMLKAKHFLAHPSEEESPRGEGLGGLSFQFSNRKGPNFVKIVLNYDDTYTMTFARRVKYDLKSKKEHENIYASQLRNIFERETGLYLNI